MASGGFFARLRERLGKTRTSLVGGVRRIFAGRDRLDEGVYQELEETLIEADLGVETTLQIVADMRRLVRERGLATPDELYGLLKAEMAGLMAANERVGATAMRDILLSANDRLLAKGFDPQDPGMNLQPLFDSVEMHK